MGLMLYTGDPLPESQPQPAQPSGSQLHTLAFHGTGEALFILVLKNMVLTVLTLGIYLAWAKTARRAYIWRHVEIEGHPLRYHGTGKELFIGYLKLAAGYLVFFGLPVLVGRVFGPMAQAPVQLALGFALVFLIPIAIWGARRYLLSRTSWRGVHFRLEGDGRAYAKTFIGGYLLSVLSLGLYAPIWLNRLHRFMTNATAIGTKCFEYRGEDKVVFKLALRGIILSILTLGIYYFWYQAELNRYRMANTRFDGAHGELSLTGGDLLGLTALQVVGLTLSLGLAFPWIATYSLRYTLERLRFVGPIDFALIRSAPSDGQATADGLADALDVGLGI